MSLLVAARDQQAEKGDRTERIIRICLSCKHQEVETRCVAHDSDEALREALLEVIAQSQGDKLGEFIQAMAKIDLKVNIRDEMAVSDAAWEEAQLLQQNGRWRGAVSRAYYAAFHAACSLLLTLGKEHKTPGDILEPLSLHFVREGALPPEAARIYKDLYAACQGCDYERNYEPTSESTASLLQGAASFRSMVRSYLQREGHIGA